MNNNTHIVTFTGKAPRKGSRTPLNKNKYSEQRDEETGYGYFGARYMDHELMTMWLSVDPMADKYPGISPYAYCVWNPVKLVDPDGKWPRRGVNIYMLKTTAGVGLGYGLEASWKYGIATDRKGMTHFSAVSTMHLTNQNLNDGSSRPSLEIGLDIGASLGFERNFSFNSFYDAYHSSLSEFSVGGKGIVGGSVGIGDDSFSASIGIGFSLNVSTEQYSIVQSISLSQEESHKVGYLGVQN